MSDDSLAPPPSPSSRPELFRVSEEELRAAALGDLLIAAIAECLVRNQGAIEELAG